MGAVASGFEDVWDGLGAAAGWVGDAVGDAAEWTFENIPLTEEIADIGGVFADVALAPVKLSAKALGEVSNLPGLEWMEGATNIAQDVLHEVSANASPFHMMAYAADDAKTLKDAIKVKKNIESNNRALARVEDAKDAKEKAKHIKHLLRGKGNTSAGVASQGVSKKAKGVPRKTGGGGTASQGVASQGVAR